MRKSVRRGIQSLVAVALISLLTGCWDLKEIENVSFVLGLGIDRTPDGQIECTVQVPRPQALNFARGQSISSAAQQFIAVTGTGSTAWAALMDADKKTSRGLFLGHLQVLVIGEEMARSDLGGIFDGLIRQPEVNRHARVFLAKSARQIVTHPVSAEIMPALYFTTFFEASSNTETTTEQDLWRVWLDLVSPNASVMLPLVRVEQTQLQLSGFGLVSDRHLVAEVNGSEARGVNWTANKVRGGSVVTTVRGHTLTILILEASHRITGAWWENGQAHVEMNISIKGELVEDETMKTQIDLTLREEIEQQVAQIVKDEAQRGIEVAQKARADVFEFGEYLRAADPRRWDPARWPEKFPEAEIHVAVKARVYAKTVVR